MERKKKPTLKFASFSLCIIYANHKVYIFICYIYYEIIHPLCVGGWVTYQLVVVDKDFFFSSSSSSRQYIYGRHLLVRRDDLKRCSASGGELYSLLGFSV